MNVTKAQFRLTSTVSYIEHPCNVQLCFMPGSTLYSGTAMEQIYLKFVILIFLERYEIHRVTILFILFLQSILNLKHHLLKTYNLHFFVTCCLFNLIYLTGWKTLYSLCYCWIVHNKRKV